MAAEPDSSGDLVCSLFESYRSEIDTDQDLKE
uniref:Uncharacterized protein n=1 Tax=Plectus sambesii TaxID=2011161 RepID=A0A914V514_9BILA